MKRWNLINQGFSPYRSTRVGSRTDLLRDIFKFVKRSLSQTYQIAPKLATHTRRQSKTVSNLDTRGWLAEHKFRNKIFELASDCLKPSERPDLKHLPSGDFIYVNEKEPLKSFGVYAGVMLENDQLRLLNASAGSFGSPKRFTEIDLVIFTSQKIMLIEYKYWRDGTVVIADMDKLKAYADVRSSLVKFVIDSPKKERVISLRSLFRKEDLFHKALLKVSNKHSSMTSTDRLSMDDWYLTPLSPNDFKSIVHFSNPNVKIDGAAGTPFESIFLSKTDLEAQMRRNFLSFGGASIDAFRQQPKLFERLVTETLPQLQRIDTIRLKNGSVIKGRVSVLYVNAASGFCVWPWLNKPGHASSLTFASLVDRSIYPAESRPTGKAHASIAKSNKEDAWLWINVDQSRRTPEFHIKSTRARVSLGKTSPLAEDWNLNIMKRVPVCNVQLIRLHSVEMSQRMHEAFMIPFPRDTRVQMDLMSDKPQQVEYELVEINEISFG